MYGFYAHFSFPSLLPAANYFAFIFSCISHQSPTKISGRVENKAKGPKRIKSNIDILHKHGTAQMYRQWQKICDVFLKALSDPGFIVEIVINLYVSCNVWFSESLLLTPVFMSIYVKL